MGRIILVLLMLISVAQAQDPGYTKINARYEWLAGRFYDLIAPGYNGTPVGRPTGASLRDGAIAVDTTNHRFYIYSGGAWVRVANYTETPGGGAASKWQNVLTAGATSDGRTVLTGTNTISGVSTSVFVMDSMSRVHLKSLKGTDSSYAYLRLGRIVGSADEAYLSAEDTARRSELQLNGGTAFMRIVDKDNGLRKGFIEIGEDDYMILESDSIYMTEMPITTDLTNKFVLMWDSSTGSGSGGRLYAYESLLTQRFGVSGEDERAGQNRSFTGLNNTYSFTVDSVSSGTIRARSSANYAELRLVPGIGDTYFRRLKTNNEYGITMNNSTVLQMYNTNSSTSKSSSIYIVSDSVNFTPNEGQMNIDTLRSWAATTIADTAYKKVMTWDTRNGRWEYGNWHGAGGGGSGTVTSFTFTDGSGFDGTVTNSTTTPTLSLTTTVTNQQVMVSNSGAISGDAGLTFDPTANTVGVTGPASSLTNGPKTRFFFDSDANPALDYLMYNHDNLNMAWDSYFDGGAGAWKASYTSAFGLTKNADRFLIMGNSGLTAGSTFTPTERFGITAGGEVRITSLAGTGTRLVTADTDGDLSTTTLTESSYTPTLFNTTNIAASTASVTHWQRIGDVYHVWGDVTIDATTALTISELGMSLPISTGVANTYEVAGTAAFEDNTAVQITGDTANGRAKFRFTPQTATNNKYSFHFTVKYIAP